MNKPVFGILGPLAAMTAGCATMAEDVPVAGGGSCDAGAVQGLVGETASQELGAEAMRLSGVGELRWIPPNSAVTMDFRPTRLNIEFDGNSIVRTLRCG